MANNAHHHDEDDVNKIQQRLRADIMGLLDYSIDNNAPLERFIFIRNLLLVTMTSDAAALYGTSSFKDNPAPQHEKFATHASAPSNEEAADGTDEEPAPAPKKTSKAKAAKKSAPKPAAADEDDGFDSELGAPFDADDEGPAPKKETKPVKSKAPAKKDPEPSFEDDDELFGGGDSAESSSLGRVADSADDEDDGFGDDEPAPKKAAKSAGKASPKEASPITTDIEDDEFF